jgi:hypothetical protein
MTESDTYLSTLGNLLMPNVWLRRDRKVCIQIHTPHFNTVPYYSFTEYQTLLKSLMTPANDINKELVKARRSEAKWQRECQELVAKLDLEVSLSLFS